MGSEASPPQSAGRGGHYSRSSILGPELPQMTPRTPRSKDPVADALEMKKRQLEAQQRLLERRREQEMQECSFSPQISHVSRELAETNPYRRAAPLHERSIRHAIHAFEDTSSHKVQMNETSRVLAAALPGRDVPIGERSAKAHHSFMERMKKEAEDKKQREITEATHSPHIDKVSVKLVQKRQGPQDALSRLTDEYLRKREDARDRLKREADDKMTQALAKPVYVNKQSERLLQRAADSGREVKGIDARCKTPRTAACRETSQRFDCCAPTPLGGASRSQSRGQSPMSTPRTPRASMVNTTPANTTSASESSRSRNAKSKSPSCSPESPHHVLLLSMPRGRQSDFGESEDDKICAANPNSIGIGSGSDIKWLARMAHKTGIEPRQASSRSGDASPSRARSGGATGAFNPFLEMDKMRLEFQKMMKEKEEETRALLEQMKAQKAEASNGELREENETLRDDLEAQVEQVSELEMAAEDQRMSLQEVEDERDQLRNANEKLRLDLEAITEKGQAVVELNAKLMVQIKTLKSKALGKGKSKHKVETEAENKEPQILVQAIHEPSNASKVQTKQFAEFLNDSDDSSPENSRG